MAHWGPRCGVIPLRWRKVTLPLSYKRGGEILKMSLPNSFKPGNILYTLLLPLLPTRTSILATNHWGSMATETLLLHSGVKILLPK